MTVNQIAKAIAAEIEVALTEGLTPSLAVERAWATVSVPNELYKAVKKEVWASIGKIFNVDSEDFLKAWRRVNDADVRRWVAKASQRMRINVRAGIEKSLKEGEAVRAAAARIGDSASPQAIRREIAVLKSSPITAQQAKSLENRIRAGVKGEGLRAKYLDVIKVANDPEKVKKQIKYAAQEAARSQAERIVRTEMERAYYAARTQKIANDPDAKYVQIKLSSTHNISDICNAVAAADVGFGPGIYPLDKAPVLPLHPNCGCRLYPVYVNKGVQVTSSENAINDAKTDKTKGDVKFTQIR
jgi:hypothetical protein